LKVALEARDHQELLELLGGLRQGVELAGVEAGGGGGVAGTPRRRGWQQRRLYLPQVAPVPKIPHVLDEPLAEKDVVAHLLPAKVQVAVLQAQGFVDGAVALYLERRGLGGVEYPQGGRLDLDLPRRQVGVLVALRAGGHLALDRDRPLRPQRLGLRELLRVVRVEGDLGDAPPVAQVYKDESAVVAAAVDPPGEPRRLADVRFAQAARVLRPVRVLRVHPLPPGQSLARPGPMGVGKSNVSRKRRPRRPRRAAPALVACFWPPC